MTWTLSIRLRWTLHRLLIATIVVVAALPASGSAASASPSTHPSSTYCTDDTLSSSPDNGYTTLSASFSFLYTNVDPNSLTINSFTVTYSWKSSSVNLGGASIPGGGSTYTFTDSEVLPSSAQTASVSVSVNGKDSADWFASTCNYGPSTFTVNQLPPSPTVTATANPTTGTSPLSVSFTATVSGGLAPFTYAWTFGDGTSGAGESATHSYGSSGTFTAQVVVTDSLGRSGSNSVTITVTQSTSGLGGLGSGGAGDYIIYGAAALGAVAAVAVIVYLVRRKGHHPPPRPSASSPSQTWSPPPQ